MRNALRVYALSLITSAPLVILFLVWLDVTSAQVTPWINRNRDSLLLGICLAFTVLLQLRHLCQYWILCGVYDKPGGARWLQALATGALKGFALTLAASFFLLPLLLLGPRYCLAAPVGVFEQRFTEKALQRSWRLSDAWIDRLPRRLACLLLVVTLLAVNLHFLRPVLFSLLEVLGGLDVSQLSELMTLDRPRYLTLLAAVVFLLIDPLLTLLGAELYLEALVCEEGHDLSERLDLLVARNR